MKSPIVFLLFILFVWVNSSYRDVSQPSTRLLEENRRAVLCGGWIIPSVDKNKKLHYKVSHSSTVDLVIKSDDLPILSYCLSEESKFNNKCEAVKYAIGYYPKSLGMALFYLNKAVELDNDKWARDKKKYLEARLEFTEYEQKENYIRYKYLKYCRETNDGFFAYLLSEEFMKKGEKSASHSCLNFSKKLGFSGPSNERALAFYESSDRINYASYILNAWDAKGCESNKGLLYEEGLGVAKNLMVAEKLYLESAKMGQAAGYRNLAIFYQKNPSFKKSKQEIDSLYLKAAKLGDFFSQYKLRM